MTFENSSFDESLIRQIRAVFTDCDLNNDGIIQKEEMEQVIGRHMDSPVEAQIVALFSHCFDEIKSLHNEGWFEKKDGITLGDLFVLEEVLNSEIVDSDKEHHKKLKQMASSIIKRTEDVWNLKPSLYGSSNSSEVSVRPIAVRRGNVGNCHFLAVLAAVAATRPQEISKMIERMDNGKYSISFPGAMGKSVVVSKPTIVELSLYGQLTRMGYWPCVMEKALRKFSLLLSGTNENSELTISFCLKVLTGQDSILIDLPNQVSPNLTKELGTAFAENKAMVVVSTNSDQDDSSGTLFRNLHPYTVMNFDGEHSKVTLRDPYGPHHRLLTGLKKELRPRAKMRDGIFSVSLEEFFSIFDSVYVEGKTG